MNEIITVKNEVAVGIKNPHLRLATRRIYSIADRIRKSSLEVASIVASVEDTKTYKDDFKKSSEWGEKVFGFRRSTFFNMLKIGREWVSVDTYQSSAGEMVHEYHTILAKAGEDDYTVSQVIALFPLGAEAATELHEHGVIRPDMSVRALKEAVAKYLEEAEEADEAEEVEEAEEAEEAEEVEDEAEEVKETEEYTQSATVKIVPAEGTVYITVGEIVYEFSLEEWTQHTNIEKTVFPAKR